MSGTRICKVCGKEYEYCKTKAYGTFKWKDVACCPEHAAQYFDAIAASRGEKKNAQPAPQIKEDVKDETVTTEKQHGKKFFSPKKEVENKEAEEIVG